MSLSAATAFGELSVQRSIPVTVEEADTILVARVAEVRQPLLDGEGQVVLAVSRQAKGRGVAHTVAARVRCPVSLDLDPRFACVLPLAFPDSGVGLWFLFSTGTGFEVVPLQTGSFEPSELYVALPADSLAPDAAPLGTSSPLDFVARELLRGMAAGHPPSLEAGLTFLSDDRRVWSHVIYAGDGHEDECAALQLWDRVQREYVRRLRQRVEARQPPASALYLDSVRDPALVDDLTYLATHAPLSSRLRRDALRAIAHLLPEAAVTVRDPAGNVTTSLPRLARFFTHPPPAPAALSPADTVTAGEPTLTWSFSGVATRFTVQLDGPEGTKGWQNLPTGLVCHGGESCSYTPTRALMSGSYRWKVSASNSVGTGPWSATLDFSVGTADPLPLRPR